VEAIIYCKICAEVPRERVPKHGKAGQSDTSERSQGAGYARDRGLGFSLEAAPSWDADALFQKDKAGLGPARTHGNKTKREAGYVKNT